MKTTICGERYFRQAGRSEIEAALSDSRAAMLRWFAAYRAAHGWFGKTFRSVDGRLCQPDGEPEFAAKVRLTLNSDSAAHHFHQPFADRQPEAAAAVLTGS